MRSEIIRGALNNSYETLYENLPTRAQVAKAAKTMVLSTVALEALCNLPGAQGGPISYAACIAAVCGSTSGAACPAALAVCAAALGPWCP